MAKKSKGSAPAIHTQHMDNTFAMSSSGGPSLGMGRMMGTDNNEGATKRAGGTAESARLNAALSKKG